MLRVVKDNPVSFLPLDESSGTTAFDISGCENHGVYTGGLTTNIFPLVEGGVSGTIINSTKYITVPVSKDFTGSISGGTIGDKNSSDNDFTMEVWIYSKITSSSYTTIFADPISGIGLFWDNGNIVFQIQGERVEYTVPFYKRALHIAASYSVGHISLYLNGSVVVSKEVEEFEFTNESLSLQIGPTSNASDSFIVDAPAFYRYTLSEDRIAAHYFEANPVPALQIASPDKGSIVYLTDRNIKQAYSKVYPRDKSFGSYVHDNLEFNLDLNYIRLIKTEASESRVAIIEDYFTIPNGMGLATSKLEWHGDNGIAIQTSTTGLEGSWENCINGEAIPQFKIGSETFSDSHIVYFRIIFLSPDTSKYIPKLEYLGFYFFLSKNVYSANSSEYISSEEPVGLSGIDSWDYDLGTDNYPILSRHNENGIRPRAGFSLNTDKDVKSIEMFFTPIDLSANYLLYSKIDTGNVSYSWNSSGVISKSNISSVYVNGINRTSSTNISSFLTVGEPHHIVITSGTTCTEKVWFNIKSDSGVWSNNGPRNLYKNITVYEDDISSKATEHYNLYTSKASCNIQDSSFTLTETSLIYHDDDWSVVQGK